MLDQKLEAGNDVSGIAHIVVCGTCHLVHYSPVGKAGSPQHVNCQGKNKHKTSYLRKPDCKCVPSHVKPVDCTTHCSC